MHRRRLPIASPCHERFASMHDRGSARFCDRCQQSVHDLSAMTKAQAERFLLQHEGQTICVRYEMGRDDRLRFRPPPARVAGPMVVTLAGLMAACTGHLEAAELDMPEDALMCQDEVGYTIPCVEGEEGTMLADADADADAKADADEYGAEATRPSSPIDEPTDERFSERVDPMDEEPEDPEAAQGCPLQQWDDAANDEPRELLGRVDVSRLSRSEHRRIEREYRREQRLARRHARR